MFTRLFVVLCISFLCLASCTFTTTVKTAPKLKVSVGDFNQHIANYSNCTEVQTYGRVTRSNNTQNEVLCMDMKFNSMPPDAVIDSVGMTVAAAAKQSLIDATTYTRYEVKFIAEQKDGMVTQTNTQTRVYYPQ